jgi:tetratricopeptide (TPR) repeat protein
MNTRRFKAWVVAGILGLGVGGAGVANDTQALFQMGREAYYKGNFEQAYELLRQVEARQPNHFETKALLAQIRSQMKPGVSSLKKTYAGVTLAKVEFAEVTLDEAVQALRVLAKNASDGRVTPNFLIKGEELKTKVVSLRLEGIPLSEAIDYLARLSGARVVYEAHAVVFQPAAG